MHDLKPICRAPQQQNNKAAQANGGNPSRGLARAAKRERQAPKYGLIKSLKTYALTYTAAAGLVQSLSGGVRALAAVFLLLLLPLRAPAISGTVAQVVVQIATDAELAETVGPRGVLVQRASDPKDLRILDGYTPGGISLWNFAALTNPPSLFPHDVQMDHHHVRLDGSYSLNAEAGRMTAWYGTNVLWQIVGAATAADDVILSVVPEGTNMAFTVASESDEIAVEVSSSLLDPVWTPIAFGFERLTPLTVKVTVPNPPVGEMQYVRVLTGGGDVGMAISVPLSVPALSVGGAGVTAESISAWNALASYDITTNLIANWNAAYGWGDHAQAGYLTAEADPAFDAWLAADPLDGLLSAEADPAFSASAAYGITTNLIAAWNLAASYGDHAAAGYVKDASGWSSHAATQTVDYAGNNISDAGVVEALNLVVTGTVVTVLGPMVKSRDATEVSGYAAAFGGETKAKNFGIAAGYDSYAGYGGAAFGLRAKNTNVGSFVFSDYTEEEDFDRGAYANTFSVRARGGSYFESPIFTVMGKVEARGGYLTPANTTNYFLRPDGGTNTIEFDVDGTMYIYAGPKNAARIAAISITTNGNIGVKTAPGSSYPMIVGGTLSATTLRAGYFTDSGGGQVDPSGTSSMNILGLSGTLTATQGVSQIILPTSTNGLVPGTLWNNSGTVSVMP